MRAIRSFSRNFHPFPLSEPTVSGYVYNSQQRRHISTNEEDAVPPLAPVDVLPRVASGSSKESYLRSLSRSGHALPSSTMKNVQSLPNLEHPVERVWDLGQEGFAEMHALSMPVSTRTRISRTRTTKAAEGDWLQEDFSLEEEQREQEQQEVFVDSGEERGIGRATKAKVAKMERKNGWTAQIIKRNARLRAEIDAESHSAGFAPRRYIQPVQRVQPSDPFFNAITAHSDG